MMPRAPRPCWPLEDRIGATLVAAGSALTWTGIAILGGRVAIGAVLAACAWLLLVAIGGMTGGGR
jgi:hypothetical protein